MSEWWVTGAQAECTVFAYKPQWNSKTFLILLSKLISCTRMRKCNLTSVWSFICTLDWLIMLTCSPSPLMLAPTYPPTHTHSWSWQTNWRTHEGSKNCFCKLRHALGQTHFLLYRHFLQHWWQAMPSFLCTQTAADKRCKLPAQLAAKKTSRTQWLQYWPLKSTSP